MIKITFESAGHPDYFRIVGAEMDKEYTAIEFIEEILKTHPRDYGRFTLGNISYDYKNGVLDWALLYQEVMNKVVVGVKGMSSYFNTDYELTLE